MVSLIGTKQQGDSFGSVLKSKSDSEEFSLRMHKKAQNYLVIFAGIVFILFALFANNPKFLSDFGTHIPYAASGSSEVVTNSFRGGDHIQVYYLAWKLKKGLEGSTPSIFSDYFNFASDSALFYDIHIGLQYWLIALSSFVLGDVAGFNFGWVVLPLILSFIFAYFMLAAVTTSYVVRVVGSLVIVFLPYRISQMFGGHSGGIIYFLLPLYFGSVFRAHFGERKVFWVIVAGICLLVTTISDEHLGYYLLLFSSLVFPIWGLQHFLRDRTLKSITEFIVKWLPLIGGLVATVAFGLVVNKLLYDPAVTISPIRSFGEIAYYSPSPTDVWTTYGTFVLISFFVWLVVSLLDFRKITFTAYRNTWLPVIFATLILTILALGIGQHPMQQSGVYQFFYKYYPFFNYQRVSTKILAPVICLVVTLIAVLYNHVKAESARQTSRKHWLYSILSYLLLAGLTYQGWSFVRQWVDSRHIGRMRLADDRLKDVTSQVGKDSIVLALPIREKMDVQANYAQFLAYNTGRRVANGYVGNPPFFYIDARSNLLFLNEGILTQEGVESIRKNGYDFVWLDASQFVSPAKMTAVQDALKKVEGVSCVVCESKTALFRIDHTRLKPNRDFLYGWGVPSSKAEKSGQWMRLDTSPVHPDYTNVNMTSFQVRSLVKLGAHPGRRRIKIVYQPAFDESLWLIGRDGKQLELIAEGGNSPSKHVEFDWSDNSFYLATKSTFSPMKSGASDSNLYGHFIETITDSGDKGISSVVGVL